MRNKYKRKQLQEKTEQVREPRIFENKIHRKELSNIPKLNIKNNATLLIKKHLINILLIMISIKTIKKEISETKMFFLLLLEEILNIMKQLIRLLMKKIIKEDIIIIYVGMKMKKRMRKEAIVLERLVNIIQEKIIKI